MTRLRRLPPTICAFHLGFSLDELCAVAVIVIVTVILVLVILVSTCLRPAETENARSETSSGYVSCRSGCSSPNLNSRSFRWVFPCLAVRGVAQAGRRSHCRIEHDRDIILMPSAAPIIAGFHRPRCHPIPSTTGPCVPGFAGVHTFNPSFRTWSQLVEVVQGVPPSLWSSS